MAVATIKNTRPRVVLELETDEALYVTSALQQVTPADESVLDENGNDPVYGALLEVIGQCDLGSTAGKAVRI
jgi:hypothetical protein